MLVTMFCNGVSSDKVILPGGLDGQLPSRDTGYVGHGDLHGSCTCRHLQPSRPFVPTSGRTSPCEEVPDSSWRPQTELALDVNICSFLKCQRVRFCASVVCSGC